MAKQQKWLSQIAWIQQKAGLAKESYVYVCVRDPPRPPRGPRWHHPTLTVKGGIEGYQGPPLILFVRRMFRKGATHWVTGKLSEEGEKYMQPCLTLCQRKDGQGIKRHGRDEISCGKRYETRFHLNIYIFLYKNGKILDSETSSSSNNADF